MNSSRRGLLRNLALLAAASMLLGGAAAGQGTPEHAKKVKIGFLVDSLQVERWQRDAEAFQNRANELGAEVVVESADGDDEKQLQQAQKLIDSGARAIVLVAHDTDKAARIVAAAKAKKVSVLCYERLIPNGDEDFYSGPNTVQIGKLQAEALVKLAPKGNYILVEGSPVDINARLLHEGHLKVLKEFVERGDIRVVATVWAKDWSPVAAYSDTLAAIDSVNGDVAAVVAANDGTAGGAIQALTDRKLDGKVSVSGQDADLAAIVRILNGTQSMTIYRPLGTLAAKTAEEAVRLARGQDVETRDTISNGSKDVPAYLVGVVAVSRGNIRETVIKDGFQNLETIEKSVPRDKWPQ